MYNWDENSVGTKQRIGIKKKREITRSYQKSHDRSRIGGRDERHAPACLPSAIRDHVTDTERRKQRRETNYVYTMYNKTMIQRVKSSRKDRREVTDVSPVCVHSWTESRTLPVSAAQSTFSSLSPPPHQLPYSSHDPTAHTVATPPTDSTPGRAACAPDFPSLSSLQHDVDGRCHRTYHG